MKDYTLEVCADSVESVLAAESGGATRIELCRNLVIGGTTPDSGLVRQIRKYSDIRIHVLMRPRYGDFLYSDHEFEIMKDEISMFRELGVQGIVIGMLCADGHLDTDRMNVLKETAGDMSVTLHRAFDLCADPMEAMEQAIQMGIDTILTSGQRECCVEGAELLAKLQEKSAGRIVIQAGAGVDKKAVEYLYKKTGIRAYHMSGKKISNSAMEYRRMGVCMGLPSISEYELMNTDEDKVREVKELLEGL